jgi:ornithine cyclodeaminase/alanine dehydrogenase-like protein (mu-crystallin family)
LLALSEREIRALYSMKDCLKDVESAFRAHQEGQTDTPVRIALSPGKGDATTLYMPAYVEPAKAMGIKIASVFPDNAKRGKPVIQGMMLLTDAETGEHLALMDATYLTVLRTGAISGVATRYLAREDARICTLFGAGAQAIGQIQAVMEVRNLEEIRLWNRTREKAEQLKQGIRETHPDWPGTIRIFDHPEDAVQEADIILCATRSTKPLFDGELVRPGTHVNPIGAYLPHMREVDATLLHRSSKVVVDTREGALQEAGDLLIPMNAGEWDAEQLYGELAEIVSEKKPGRESPEEITVFKSVGVAFLDTMVAKSVYERARRLDRGTVIDL